MSKQKFVKKSAALLMLSLTTLGTGAVLTHADSLNADGTQVLKLNNTGKVNQTLINPITGQNLKADGHLTQKAKASIDLRSVKGASSSTPHPVWGYAMWTQETEFKSLSGRKPEPSSNLQPGFGAPLKWYDEDVYKLKEGDKFVLTNVTIANNGKKASLLMTVGKVQEKSQWGKRSPVLDNTPAFSIKNSGIQTVTAKNGTTFSIVDQPMFGQGGDIFYNWDMEFVDASDNKTPVDVSVQNGWADIDVLQGATSKELLPTDPSQLFIPKAVGGIPSVSYNASKQQLTSEMAYGVNNIGAGDLLGIGKVDDFGFGYVQPKSAYHGSNFSLTYGDQAADLDSSILNRLPEVDAVAKPGGNPKTFKQWQESRQSDVDALPETGENSHRGYLAWGLFGMTISNMFAPQHPTAPELKLPKAPTMDNINEQENPLKSVLDDDGTDINGQVIPNAEKFNWVIEQGIKGSDTQYSDYVSYAQKVKDWTSKCKRLIAEYQTAYKLYSDTYDTSYKPMYDQYAQASQQAGTTPEPVAKKEGKADTTLPDVPDTTAKNFIINNFSITDNIDTTHVKLEDISKAIVEQWDINKGNKLATLNSKDVKISRNDEGNIAKISVDFSTDFVHSDNFYNKNYKLVLGGQTFNLTEKDKGTIEVDNIATSTIDDKPKDTNEVTVKTISPTEPKNPVAPELKLPEPPSMNQLDEQENPLKSVLDPNGKDINGQTLPNDGKFDWVIDQGIKGSDTQYSDYMSYAQKVKDWSSQCKKLLDAYSKAYDQYSDSYENSYKPEYENYVKESEQAGVTPKPMAEKAHEADTSMPKAPDTTASNFIVDKFSITDSIDTTHVNLEDISKAIVEQWDIKKGKKLATLDSKDVKITRNDEGKIAKITVDFSSDFVRSDKFYNKDYKVILAGQTFKLSDEDKDVIEVKNIAQSNINDKPKDTNEVTVKTTKQKGALPLTGSQSRGILTVLGLIMMSIAGAVVFGVKKFKKSEDNEGTSDSTAK